MKQITKKWTLFLVATFVTFFGIGYTLLKGTRANGEEFADMNFYKCVVDAYNKENNATVDYSTTLLNEKQLSQITKLECSGKDKADDEKITSVQGIELLSSLKELLIQYNLLESLDVSQNLKLTRIEAQVNKISNLDITHNTELTKVVLNYNLLTSLDVSKNTKLTHLSLFNNNLTSIDVSKNTELTYLSIQNNGNIDTLGGGTNKIVNLNVDNNYKLEQLYAAGNLIKTLDLSNNPKLVDVNINNNPFGKYIYIYEGKTISLYENNNIDAVVLPDELGWGYPEWTSSNTGIVSVDNSGIITSKKSGESEIVGVMESKYTVTHKINVFKITSSKYTIDENENTISLGNDKDINVVKSNIAYPAGVDLIFYDDGNKLIIKSGDFVLADFDVISNGYTLGFDENLVVDDENDYIKYIPSGTKVSELLAMVKLNGGNAYVCLDSDCNSVKVGTDILTTGDVFATFVNSSIKDKYVISVTGDCNGDGNIDGIDLVQMRKHIVGWRNPSTNEKEYKKGIYLYSLDFNEDGIVDGIDLVRMRKTIVGVDW